MNASNATILVTGASGQLGRRIVHHLIETYRVSAERVVAATRHPKKLEDLSASGVDVRQADFDDPSSLERAFRGVDTILIISTDLMDLEHGQRLRQHERAIEAARRSGASHVGYTSMLKPEPGSPIPFASDHFGTEQALIASGINHTVFRANAYQENLLMTLPNIVRTGQWLTSAGEGRVAYAARDDMAAAIAARLASAERESATIPLTGPRAYSYAEVAARVTAVTGRPITLTRVSDDELFAKLVAFGVPEPFARLFVAVDVDTRRGTSALESDILEALSGRKSVTLDTFLEKNKAALSP